MSAFSYTVQVTILTFIYSENLTILLNKERENWKLFKNQVVNIQISEKSWNNLPMKLRLKYLKNTKYSSQIGVAQSSFGKTRNLNIWWSRPKLFLSKKKYNYILKVMLLTSFSSKQPVNTEEEKHWASQRTPCWLMLRLQQENIPLNKL